MKKLFAFLFFTLVCKIALPQWSTNSAVNTVFQSGVGDDFNNIMVPDGNGGTILFYATTPDQGMTFKLYVKRINADGTISWGTSSTGLLVSDGANDRYYTSAVSDGAGGAIVTWVDYRNNVSAGDIYIQRVNSSGAFLWGTNGKLVTTAASTDDYDSYLVADGAGGAIIGWSWDNGSTNIQATSQHYDTNGNALWQAGGVQLVTAAGFRFLASMVSDGAGGAIAILVDYRNDPLGNTYSSFDPISAVVNSDIYAQRINASGAVQWNTGAIVCNEAKNQGDIFRGNNVVAVEDGSGGVVVFFADYRNDPFLDGYPEWVNEDIFAQRLNSSGSRQWTASGVLVTTAERDQFVTDAVRTSTGNYCISFISESANGDSRIFGQFYDATGSAQWTANGIVLSGGSKMSTSAELLGDVSGNVIFAFIFNDLTANPTAVRVQKINSLGAAQWGTNGTGVCTNSASSGGRPMIKPSESETMIVAWSDLRNAGAGADIYGSKLAPNGSLTTWGGGPIISAANGNWNNAATWASGIGPNATSEVIIRHTVTVTANTTAKKVTVENPGGNLRLNAGVSVTVSQ